MHKGLCKPTGSAANGGNSRVHVDGMRRGILDAQSRRVAMPFRRDIMRQGRLCYTAQVGWELRECRCAIQRLSVASESEPDLLFVVLRFEKPARICSIGLS